MEPLVGRVVETALLSGLVADVAAGRGGVVVVEGEPGIGKTALVAASLAEAQRLGCGVVRGAGDELLGRFPLRVLLDAFDIRLSSGDERRRAVAEAVGGGSPGVLFSGDPVAAAAEELVALVERLCADAPLVVAVDDLHWVDGASLALWVRLAALTEQVPLLLVGACRSVPYRQELDAIRQVAQARGHRLGLQPLATGEVAQLVGRLAGAMPDAGLLAAMEAAAGNPLWVRETTVALVREDAIRLRGEHAGLADPSYRAPGSLLAAVGQRLTFLSPAAAEVARSAALLGGEFSVSDLAVVSNRRPSDLIGVVGEASAAGVLGEAGGRLGFRHPLIRQALYEQVPASVRSAMHRDAARGLAGAGAPAGSVAAQLLAAGGPAEAWQVEWLLRNGSALTYESPQVSVELLLAAAKSGPGLVGDERYWRVASQLARALSRRERFEDSRVWARRVLGAVADPDRAAEMCVVLSVPSPGWCEEQALTAVGEALDQPVSPRWRARLVARYAVLKQMLGHVEEAESRAREALALGETVGDLEPVGVALNVLGGASEHRGDLETALGFFQRLVDVVDDHPECRRSRITGYTNLALVLAQLDRGVEAQEAFRTGRSLARRLGAGEGSPAAFGTTLAFALGRWDDAIAEMDLGGELDSGLALVLWGVGALIAAHRDERREALALLRRTEGISRRGNSGFALAANALVAEQDGNPRAAASQLSVIVRPEFSVMTNRYELLADLVRLALATEELALAEQAAVTAEAEAARVRAPGSRFASAHCQGLLAGDPASVWAAADYYRSSGRLPLLGSALEDVAVLLAAGGDTADAHSAAREAEQVYADLGAVWDLRRMAARLRPYRVRLGVRGARVRPDSGWAALTPAEVAVARLVAEGLSNPDIAVKLLLSRRTVQTHVSHILAKLGARARLEIAHHVTSDAA